MTTQQPTDLPTGVPVVTAYEISAQLQAAGVAHCHLEGDNLDAAYPKPDDDPSGSRLTETNLRALARPRLWQCC